MQGRAVGSPPASERPAFLARLKAWWGRGGDGAAPSSAKVDQLVHRRLAAAEDLPPLDHLTIAQWLWGAGFHSPGGEQDVLDLVKPFALNPAMSMLDAAAGLGGTARAIAIAFGTYVTGLEREQALAGRGMGMSVVQGMAKRAPVSSYDPESFELRAGAFDCILGREATFAVKDKERFLRVLVLGLKPRGQLLLTDFVVGPKAGAKTALAAWEQQQPYRPSLWTVEQYTDCLQGLGFEIRITEDTTDNYRRLIVAGWDQMLHRMDLRSLPKQHVRAIVGEAEMWVRTMAALESGALKRYRFYALAGTSRPALNSVKR